MKKWICVILAVILLCMATGSGILYKLTHKNAQDLSKEKIEISDTYRPETIVTTDGECDDQNSFIHLLLCLNNMDLKGIVLTSSCYHYAGNERKGIEAYRWAGTDWVIDYIDAYGEIYDNLIAQDRNYPSSEYLKSIYKIGNIDGDGDMEAETDGSRLIAAEMLKETSEKLYIQCWGGSNTVARALKSIEEKYKTAENWEELKKHISEKVVLYLIGIQDDTYETYISKNWPEIDVLQNNKSYEALAFNWKFVLNEDEKTTMYSEWQTEKLLHVDNPLMKLYYTYYDDRAYKGEFPQYQYGLKAFNIQKFWRLLTYHGGFFKYGDFLSEGDSPAFLFLLDKRLENCESYEMENWGGTFKKVKEHYYIDDCIGDEAIGKYVTDINEDFARRVVWSEK